MSHRSAAKPAAGIQLLPLLAVLICTMGALILLLVGFARHGQKLASDTAKMHAASDVDADIKRDELEWRIGHLKEARSKTEAQLGERRLELSHIEDHQRRLMQELERLKTSVKEMERLGTAGANERKQTADELELLESQIVQAERQRDNAKREAQNKAVTYSVVPYEGPNQTRRHPIYIECLADAVVLQPEGITLVEADFEGPMGPGNPLAAALRAAREHMAENQNAALKEEPYPLLLVRPDGIIAYYAARAALMSWGSAFGYELVGQDWKLEFPPTDPQLKNLMREVVSEARVRQEELIKAAPRRYAKNRPTYRASPHGGFVQEHAVGGGGESGGAFGGLGKSNGSLGGRRSGGQSGSRQDGIAGGYGSGARGGSAAGAPGGSASGSSAGSAEGSPGAPPSAGSPDGWARSGGSSANGSTGMPDLADSASDGRGGRSGSSSSGTASGGAQQQASGQTGGQSNGQSAGQSGGDSSQSGQQSMTSVTLGKKPESLAEKRGRDWGLPEAAPKAVAVTRPIFIVCATDRLAILSEDGARGGKEIPLAAHTEDSVDDLVSAVGQHMKTWGIAGKGLYWRPTLLVDVQPGAAARYAELEALMKDSGLEVRQRQRTPSTANPPASAKRR